MNLKEGKLWIYKNKRLFILIVFLLILIIITAINLGYSIGFYAGKSAVVSAIKESLECYPKGWLNAGM